MRGRIVLLILLAIVIALVGVYVGGSTSTPEAIGQPSTPTPPDSSVGSPQPPTTKPPTKPPTTKPPTTKPAKEAPTTEPPTKPPTTKPPNTKPPTTKPPTTKPPSPSAEVRFGRVVVTEPSSDDKYTLNVSPDLEVFTVAFNDREATTETEEKGVPTRSLAMTMPLSNGAKGKTLSVYVQGYALAGDGASARLTLKLNGLVKVRNFLAGWDDSYIQTLELPAIPAATYQLEGVVEVHQNPGTDGGAYLNVLSIDSSFS